MKLKLFFFLLIPFLGISQVQLGQDVDGEAYRNHSGFSVSLSSNGRIVAVGTVYGSNGVFKSGGYVSVYEYINASGLWKKIGNNINGRAAYDDFGNSVSISADGKIVAVGANTGNTNNLKMTGYVRVFHNVSGSWVQLGQDINGELAYDQLGKSVSLSADGTTLAIGIPHKVSSIHANGQVVIYKFISGAWVQVGNKLNGDTAYDSFGLKVALSSNGNTLAITAPGGYQHPYSYVRVYNNISGVWTQIGNDIVREGVFDYMSSISISADGTILAVGAHSNNGNGFSSGHVRIFKNVSGLWIQVGSDIDGEAPSDSSGHSVSLSADGNTIAIGAFLNDGINGVDSGHTRVYKNFAGVWTQLGIDIDGERSGDHSGFSVSLSADGNTVAIGAKNNSEIFEDAGQLRVYDLTKTASSNQFVLDNFNIYPNPTSDILNISLESNLVFEKAVVYNNLGQIVKEANQEVINVSELAKGIYYVEVTTNQGRATKKVIIK